jgi:hypothetical protein
MSGHGDDVGEQRQRLPSMFPYVWLPTFLVQAALFGHLLVFRAIGARGRWSGGEGLPML